MIVAKKAAEHSLEGSREFGRYGCPSKGPILIVFCGIHGNEPAGYNAFMQLEEKLRQIPTEAWRGCLLGVWGNRNAFVARQRYLDEDFNRIWTSEALASQKERCTQSSEAREQRALLDYLAQLQQETSAPFTILDLHTCSAPSSPFGIVGQTQQSRQFAVQFPIPMIFNLDAYVSGALMHYLGRCGHTTLAFEAGQHDAPESIHLHESLIWHALEKTGLLSTVSCRSNISNPPAPLPNVAHAGEYRVFYRHSLQPEDEFRMEPGFANFTPVHKGQLLAQSSTGPVHCPQDSFVFLPLYQNQGSDGFFLVEKSSQEQLT